MNIRDRRLTLRLSQTRLAALAKVSRFKICLHERGDQFLSADELGRIQRAFQEEAERMRRDLKHICADRAGIGATPVGPA
jgi:predicted transcriptional regulator